LPPILRIEDAVQNALEKTSLSENRLKKVVAFAECNNSESFFIIEKMAQACQEY
jgi:hypothetical protein